MPNDLFNVPSIDGFCLQNILSHICIIGYGGDVTIRSTLFEEIESIFFEFLKKILLVVFISEYRKGMPNLLVT